MSDWDDDRRARVRQLWADGMSTAKMAGELKTTKNAIVGLVHRMDLPRRDSPIKSRSPLEPKRIGGFPKVGRPSQRRAASAPSTLEVLGMVPASLAGPGLPVVAEMAPPVAPLVPVRWSGRECCWPIGEPRTKAFRYCDEPAVTGRSYCAEHHAMSVQKVPAKTFLVPGGVRV